MAIPALVRAVASGVVVGLLGTIPWASMVTANTRVLPTVPWASLAMAVILFAWWRYFVRGRGWPGSTAEARRRAARANPVPDDLWGPALGAGLLGLVTTLLLQGVLGRLVTLPQQQDLDPSQYPVLTVAAWILMSAVVAGVVEETAFRGYMQGGIERRHGLPTAILVTGTAFSLIHFTHPEVGIVLLPFYLSVAAVYGLMTAATNSIYPSLVLHAGGNMFAAVNLFTQGQSEWQLPGTPALTIWQSGLDGAFLANLAMFVVAGGATVMAFRGLFKAAASAISPAANHPDRIHQN
jgi:membrane protease YdiL (CAAX protease family)